ncbi:MAG: hypothetical protein IKZ52_07370 [Bacteroidales bacterium]|nr:hypothetical protein [Bacteroidales bacterium]
MTSLAIICNAYGVGLVAGIPLKLLSIAGYFDKFCHTVGKLRHHSQAQSQLTGSSSVKANTVSINAVGVTYLHPGVDTPGCSTLRLCGVALRASCLFETAQGCGVICG